MLRGKRFAILGNGTEPSGGEVLLFDTAQEGAVAGVAKQGDIPWLWHYSAAEKDWFGPDLRDDEGKQYRVVDVDYKNRRICLFEK